MKIKKLSVKYNPTGIEIQNVEFDSTLTLFVGISGVGKTRILSAINDLLRVANGVSLNGFSWDADFELNGYIYNWKGQFEYKDENPFNKIALPIMMDEENNKTSVNLISESLSFKGKKIFNRSGEDIEFKGKKIPTRFSSDRSLLTMFNEPEVSDFLKEVSRIKLIHDSNYSRQIMITTSSNLELLNDELDLSNVINLENISVIFKFYILQTKFESFFNEICATYKQIFPYVESIQVDKFLINSKDVQFILSIKEYGVDKWITQDCISTGMLKTFFHLIYVYLSPRGTIFLIDEFENGFGVNCINAISEHLLNIGSNYQFIVTSHHPYIINKIPVDKWKIVSREKNVIKSYVAKDYIDSSNHESFIKLINSDFYRNSIHTENNDDDWTEEDFE